MQTSTTDAVQAAPAAQGAEAWNAFTRRWRLAVAVGWVLLLGLTVVYGERAASLHDLRQAVASGQVHAVRVDGSLGPSENGSTPQHVHWRDGLVRRTTEVIESQPVHGPPRHSERDGVPVVGEDIGTQLQSLQPALAVDRSQRLTWPSNTVRGWQLPEELVWVMIAVVLGTFLLLTASPQPLRATRWAWFWLMVTVPAVGVPAYLLLAGPVPHVPAPRHPARRLTGGRGLLLGVLLSIALTIVVAPIASFGRSIGIS